MFNRQGVRIRGEGAFLSPYKHAGGVAEGLGDGLQIRLRRFNSGRHLHPIDIKEKLET